MIRTFKTSHQRDEIRFATSIFLFAFVASAAVAGTVGREPVSVSMAGNQIVQRMMECNEERAKNLQHYMDERHYHVQYTGFPANLAASMDVEATYDAPSTKSFHILSQSGSKLLLDHVLKKLLEAEKDSTKNPSRSALTPINYKFTLIGTETTAEPNLYVFHVEPRFDRKFLYRGTIWVDAKDFAVVKIEAEPARNPSFWIEKTVIHHTYSKTGEFWLPKRNRSETKARIGGAAVLTIDYGVYHIRAAVPSR